MTVAVPPRLDAEIPLVSLFPALAAIPRARLGVRTTPVEQVEGVSGVRDLWIKRDDLSAELVGGNKVRSLEFLLGRVTRGDTVATVGGLGSTHVLATATHAARIGARTIAVRWPHDMSPIAREVERAAKAACAEVVDSQHFVTGWTRGALRRLRRDLHHVPLGGATPLGVLGQVNAGLELAAQVADGAMPAPTRVVVPMGTGATAAGLALGASLGGLTTEIVAVRCGPAIGSNGFRVRHLVHATANLITRYSGVRVTPGDHVEVRVVHRAYGGAYGRPFRPAEQAAKLLHQLRGIVLDSTYSAKAWLVAQGLASNHAGATLFWLTFDARWMPSAEGRVGSVGT